MSNTLDFDSREFEKRMKIYGDKQNAVCLRIMTSNAKDLEKKARFTCPKDEGTLEGEIVSEKAERVHDGYEAYVYAGTGDSRPYALRLHEEMKPATPTIREQMQPGPVTQNKPNHPWGEAGGKYLTRPLMNMMIEYQKRIAKALDEIK